MLMVGAERKAHAHLIPGKPWMVDRFKHIYPA